MTLGTCILTALYFIVGFSAWLFVHCATDRDHQEDARSDQGQQAWLSGLHGGNT